MWDHRGSIAAVFFSAMSQELNSGGKQKYLGGWETREVVLKKVTSRLTSMEEQGTEVALANV